MLNRAVLALHLAEVHWDHGPPELRGAMKPLKRELRRPYWDKAMA